MSGGPEHRYGLRIARRLNDQTVRLSFGSSFVPAVGAQPKTYRIVSADDPDYRDGISPEKVEVATAPDVAPPAGWTGKPYSRTTVTLHLPKPMKKGVAYALQARQLTIFLQFSRRPELISGISSSDKPASSRSARGTLTPAKSR